jgi:chromosome segregation ATPase
MDYREDTLCESKVEKQPEVAGELSQLESRIKTLREKLNTLGTSLKPILQSERPEIDSCVKSKECGTDIGKAIRRNTDEIESISYAIQDLQERLEI